MVLESLFFDPYAFDTSLRQYAPGFNLLGKPTALRGEAAIKEWKDTEFTAVKSKAEVIEDHAKVMRGVYQLVSKAILAGLVGLYCLYTLLTGFGSQLYVLGAMIGFSYAGYAWWASSAKYSNWQEFEHRPLFVPLEDISAY